MSTSLSDQGLERSLKPRTPLHGFFSEWFGTLLPGGAPPEPFADREICLGPAGELLDECIILGLNPALKVRMVSPMILRSSGGSTSLPVAPSGASTPGDVLDGDVPSTF
jgi:hypothetical protein